MGCHHSSKVCNQEDEAKLQFQGGGPNNSLDALSMRRSDDVEEFFKKAYQYGNHMGALKEFMANNAAKLKLLEFLELEYYAKSPASFQEALEFLQFEADIVSEKALDNEIASVKKLSSTEFAASRSHWSNEKRKRYNEVMTEIGTVAFKKFLKSRMYSNFRSFERGALSSLRADDITRLGTDLRTASPNMKTLASDQSETKNTTSSTDNPFSLSPGSPVVQYDSHLSFARRAFNNVGVSEADKVLLHGSTWLGLLIGGVESCPIGFCMIATSSDRSYPQIVAVNSYFEKSLGYPRDRIIGSNYNLITGSDMSIFSPEMAGQMLQFHHAVAEGSNVIVEIAARNSQGEYFESIVGLRPVFDQSKVYRYMIMLCFNQKDRCTAVACQEPEGTDYEEEYRMVALCHVHYLLDLVSLIPNVFIDEDV